MLDAETNYRDEDTQAERASEAALDAYSRVVSGVADRVGPAAKAGLRVGDIIVALDGAPVAGADDLIRLLDAERIGRPASLSVIRNGRLEMPTITPRERRA